MLLSSYTGLGFLVLLPCVVLLNSAKLIVNLTRFTTLLRSSVLSVAFLPQVLTPSILLRYSSLSSSLSYVAFLLSFFLLVPFWDCLHLSTFIYFIHVLSQPTHRLWHSQYPSPPSSKFVRYVCFFNGGVQISHPLACAVRSFVTFLFEISVQQYALYHKLVSILACITAEEVILPP